MEKESYNVDDILSEVKKRREENEQQLKMESASSAQRSASVPKQKREAVSVEKNANDIKSKAHIDAQKKQTASKAAQKAPKKQTAQAPQNKGAAKKQSPSPRQNQQSRPQQAKRAQTQSAQKRDTRSREVPTDERVQNRQPLRSESQQEQMVDLFSLASIDDTMAPAVVNRQSKKNVKTKWRKTKKGKITIAIISILVILIVGAAVFGYFYINGALNKVTNDGEDYTATETYNGMDFKQENFPSINEMDASEVSSYKDYLKQWYENGEPVNSTHVKNVLLIGEDTREEEISDASRADSAIIVSINIDTKQITMTSILRDLYVYFEVDGKGQYGKINAAASVGGMKAYINTVERYYKIQIENYAVVNFASFPSIIDALGGVTINITTKEINEINNHQKRYGNVTIKQTFDGTEGKMKLNGKQALAYCRIRKIDSDGARADRQKTVLAQLLNQVKGSSTLSAAKVVNQLIDYVYTGYNKKELVSIGKYALSEGWLSYETQTINVPTAEHAKGGNFKTSSGGYMYGGWIWKSDIPKDAYDLQVKIYGKSNIKLSEDRADYVNIA